MKVAHVVRSDSFAGVERHIGLVASQLAELGCDVTVVGGDHRSMRRALGCIRWLPATSTVGVCRALLSLSSLDIVHAHMTAGEAAAVITKPIHSAQVVSTLHFASARGASLPGGLARRLTSFIDAQVALSTFVAQATTATHVICGGVEPVDTSTNHPRQRTVLVMQRMEAEKDTSVAIRAWASSMLRYQGWRLQLAGRGTEISALKALAAELAIDKSVDWLGFVEDSESLLCNAGALVATTPREAFGMAVVEAMARATPVIASGGGAHLETLGPHGWFFPPGDFATCAQLLDKLLASEVSTYGVELQARQRQLFNIGVHAHRLKDLYETLIRTAQ